MGSSNKQSTPESLIIARSEELVDQFLDAIWMERGLSKNTLGAYRADLMTLARSLAESGKTIETAGKADLLDFIAKRVESGAKPRSTARHVPARSSLGQPTALARSTRSSTRPRSASPVGSATSA